MKAKRTDDLHGFLTRNGPHRWTIVLGVSLAVLSGSLFPAPAQAAARVSLTLRGQWPGSASDVAVSDNYAYVAGSRQEGTNWIPGLQVIDVSDPASPVKVGGFDTSGDARRVQVVGTLAYVADGEAGLQILDVSNPASPVEIGGFWIVADPYSVQVVGTLAYVTYGSDGLRILDVSDPASPRQVGEFDTSGEALGIQVVGTLAYVAERPRWTGSNYVGSGLEVVDVRNPAKPVRVDGYDISEYASDAAVVVGDLIYLADGEQGLLLLEQSTAPPPPAQWIHIPTDPASTPRARHNHAMVYDEQREVVLMHGGRLQDGTVLSDTWQWDGQIWTQLATDGPQVFQHNLTYDHSRAVTVLYGGRTAVGHADPIGDTWEWDGQPWERIEVGPSSPPPPVLGGMAYDPIRQKVVRQGGITAPNDTFDVGATWEWDGQSWTQIADRFPTAHTQIFRA